jgi:hypothetical protein
LVNNGSVFSAKKFVGPGGFSMRSPTRQIHCQDHNNCLNSKKLLIKKDEMNKLSSRLEIMKENPFRPREANISSILGRS